jgi:aspartyl-tRNA(Asn)/glutamyl-tRNA(Gln) amidotransferase subunit B
MNSFKAIRDALNYEIERQKEALDLNEKIVQDTRLWDEKSGATVSMRSKEQAHDYRYFPEPDLAPIEIDEKFLEEIKKSLVELPSARKKRFIEKFGLSEYDAGVLTSEKSLADYFEKSIKNKENNIPAIKMNANWIMGGLLGRLHIEGKSIEECPLEPVMLDGMTNFILDGTISVKTAKDVFEEMFTSGNSADEIIKEKGLVQISDEKEIEKLVDEVIAENQKAAAEFKAGKQQAIGALVGSVMKKSRGQANPKIVNEILIKKLK